MRAYIHLFFGLLIPLSALFVVISVLYFKVDYDFTKSIRLGVLTGIMVSLAVSFVTSIFLQIKRLIQNGTLSPRKAKMKASIKADTKKIKKARIRKSKKGNLQTEEEENISEAPEKENNNGIDQTVMLLMDQELAFEVTLNAIKHYALGKTDINDVNKNTILIKNKKESLKITFSAPTKHTAKVAIKTDNNTKSIQKIITYLKEKEHSFLQY